MSFPLGLLRSGFLGDLLLTMLRSTLRSGRGGGFALGLLVFLVYYILFSRTKTLAVDAGLSPYIVVMPTLIFLFGGGYMLNLAINERRLPLLDRLQESIHALFKRKKKGA